MQKLKIVHRTYYNFSEPVELGTHYLRLRPREGIELHIETSSLAVTPNAKISWHSDIEGNSIASAVFGDATRQLAIESEMVVQQFNENPFDFLIEDYAVQFPFAYRENDWFVLAPYAATLEPASDSSVADWTSQIWDGTGSIETIPLLLRIAGRIQSEVPYGIREEPGVQDPTETLSKNSGSCRDFAALFIAVARHLGLAARFVSGYLVAAPSYVDLGATHAWAEVYIPGGGWKGFDPTLGIMTSSDHIPVAVTRLPDTVPPIAGSYSGSATSTMDVGVWVTPLS